MSELRTDFKDEILQEGEEHRIYNVKRKDTNEIVESDIYLEKAYTAMQEGDEFGAKEVNEIHGRLNNLSNPNLLINGDFKVNQRGQTNYTNINGWNKTYTIDRWCIMCDPNKISVTVNEDSITITNIGTSEGHFRQIFEKVLKNNKYTLTINVLSLNGDVKVKTDNNIKYDVVVGKNIFNLEDEISYINILVGPNSSIEIEYIKLEQGSFSTPFVPRLYAEELALCQRYGIPMPCIFDSYFLLGNKVHGRSLSVELFLPQTLRTTPTISGEFYVYTESSKFESITLNYIQCKENKVLIAFASNIANGNYVINCKNGYINAEIY